MSALAQLHAMSGDNVSGSDRLLDKGYAGLPLWEKLQKLGISFTSQNGSGVNAGLDALVLSSAIESDNPELARAKELNIPVIHRSEMLADHVAKFKTTAVCGTSGKSTVTAMIYEILARAGKSPSLITGGQLISLQERGLWGNVFKGKSDLLVIEADESDGSLVNYHPEIAVMLNLTKDHKDLETLRGFFKKFRPNCGKFLVNADEPNLAEFEATATFGIKSGNLRAEKVELDGFSCRFSAAGENFKVNFPGIHNVQNSLAAIAVCMELGVSPAFCASGLAEFKGVMRRFASVGKRGGVEVIDDFAHNPAKISAVLAAAKLRGKRVLAVWQPHGYAPVKLLKEELIEAFAASLSPEDRLWLPEIYYIGGTAEKDVSSKDIADALSARGINAVFALKRETIIPEIAAAAKPGDVVMVMGARDPTISDYARSILRGLGS